MELVIAALVLAVGLMGAALVVRRGRGEATGFGPGSPATAPVLAREADLTRHEAHSRSLERSLDQRAADLDRRAAEIDRRDVQMEEDRRRVAELTAEHVRALEAISGLSAGEAKKALLKEVEDDARHEQARILRLVEEDTKRDAERRVRSILSVAMQRLAGKHAAETTVSVIQLPSDDMKGRIIGREGRNIRALENITGVDLIIDDTPNAVVLSSFDGVRREVARMTLGEAPAGRTDPSGPHRGDVLPGQERARRARDRAGGGGGARGGRARPRPRAGQAARPPALPDLLRAERPGPLDRVLTARSDDGRRARGEREDGAPSGAAARHRQGRDARGARSARDRRSARSRGATASRRPSPTRWRPITTRSSLRRSRP